MSEDGNALNTLSARIYAAIAQLNASIHHGSDGRSSVDQHGMSLAIGNLSAVATELARQEAEAAEELSHLESAIDDTLRGQIEASEAADQNEAVVPVRFSLLETLHAELLEGNFYDDYDRATGRVGEIRRAIEAGRHLVAEPLRMPLPAPIKLPGITFGRNVELQTFIKAASRWRTAAGETMTVDLTDRVLLQEVVDKGAAGYVELTAAEKQEWVDFAQDVKSSEGKELIVGSVVVQVPETKT